MTINTGNGTTEAMESTNDLASTTTSIIVHQGKVMRKKRRRNFVMVAVMADGDERSKEIYIAKELADRQDIAPLLVLESFIKIKGQLCHVPSEEIRDGKPRILASKIELVRCAPDSQLALPFVVPLVLTKQLPITCLLPSNYNEGLKLEVQQKLQLLPHKKTFVYPQLIRILQGRPAMGTGRERKTFCRRTYLKAVECMEASLGDQLYPVQDVSHVYQVQPRHMEKDTTNDVTADISAQLPQIPTEKLNLPENAEEAISTHGKLTRKEYLLDKKHPQIQYFLQRIQQLEPLLLSSPTDTTLTILDVGGGRGDLTLALAQAGYRVIMMDPNDTSVQAARDYALAQNLQDKITFVVDDFLHGTKNLGQTKVDVVVALHACGDLSDAALQYAIARRAAFVICPCCYSKRFLSTSPQNDDLKMPNVKINASTGLPMPTEEADNANNNNSNFNDNDANKANNALSFTFRPLLKLAQELGMEETLAATIIHKKREGESDIAQRKNPQQKQPPTNQNRDPKDGSAMSYCQPAKKDDEGETNHNGVHPSPPPKKSNKQEEPLTLEAAMQLMGRLSEWSDRPDIGHRTMAILNSIRLATIPILIQSSTSSPHGERDARSDVGGEEDGKSTTIPANTTAEASSGYQSLTLEEYDPNKICSGRTMVLIGVP